MRYQLARARRAGMRGEIIVPVVAGLLLIAALVLSRLEAPPETELALSPTPASLTDETGTPTPTPLAPVTGYPSGSATATLLPAAPGITPTTVLTDTAIALEPSTGYPAPGDGPQPLGPPPESGFPAVPTPDLGGGYPAPVQPFPTPALIPTAPLPPAGGGFTPPPANPPAAPLPPANPPAAPPRAQPTVPSGGYPPPTDATSPAGAPEPATPPSGATPPATPPTPPTDATEAPTSTPTATPLPPTATPRTGRLLTGAIRWSTADSPVRLTEDHAIAAGASLTIDPGVEVHLAPGVRLTVAGTLRAQGTAGAPVRFLGPAGAWDAIVGVSGSTIALDHVEIRQAGAEGVALSSTGGALAIRNARLTDNRGGIISIGSLLDLRGTTITGNALTGPAINAQLPSEGAVTLVGNVLRENATPAGSPQIRLAGAESAGALNVEGNLVYGGAGPGLLIDTRVPLRGAVRCNAFAGGTIGLQLAAQRPDLRGFSLEIDANSFTGQTRYGAAGTLPFNVTNNWWGDASGPLEPQRNPQGRGVAVGVNLEFQPWLTEHPACAPVP